MREDWLVFTQHTIDVEEVDAVKEHFCEPAACCTTRDDQTVLECGSLTSSCFTCNMMLQARNTQM
eukprot:5654485-Amphidinium_carterae.1